MPRPKKDSAVPGARERLVTVYIDLMERSQKAPSVSDIAKAASCNRDTFYYHFKGIEDISQAAMETLMPKEVADALVAYLFGDAEHVTLNSRLARRAQETYALIARHAELKPYAQARLKELWTGRLNLPQSGISKRRSLLLEFVSCGTVETLTSNARDESPLPINACMETIGDFLRTSVLDELR